MITATVPMGRMAVLAALSRDVEAARALELRASSIAGARHIVGQARSMAASLDAARTRLVQDGDEYLEAARAFTSSASKLIADAHDSLGRIIIDRSARIVADRAARRDTKHQDEA